MPKIKDLKGRPPKILMYSGAGTGKTALACTLGSSLELLDLDDGLQTALTLKDDFTKARHEVEATQFREEQPHVRADAYRKFKEHLIKITNLCHQGKYPYKALCLDSISALGEMALNNIMSNSGRLGDQPEIQHWGMAIGEIKQIMLMLRALPIVVVVIGHEMVKTIGPKGGQKDMILLSIYGQNLPGTILAYFDEVWRLRVKPKGQNKFDYVINTVNNGLADAKSRSNLPSGTNVNLGLPEILKQMGYEL